MDFREHPGLELGRQCTRAFRAGGDHPSERRSSRTPGVAQPGQRRCVIGRRIDLRTDLDGRGTSAPPGADKVVRSLTLTPRAWRIPAPVSLSRRRL